MGMTQLAPFTNLKGDNFDAFRATIEPFLDRFLVEHPSPDRQHIDKHTAIRNMLELIHGKYDLHWKDSPPATKATVGFSACNAKEIVVAVDAFTVLFQFIGVSGKVCGEAATDIIEGLSAVELDGLSALFEAVSKADGAKETAKALFNLISGIYKLTGIRQILGAIESHLSWYNWVIMGTVITAQAVALFASDGASFIAEVVLLGAFLTQLGIDAAAMGETCGWV